MVWLPSASGLRVVNEACWWPATVLMGTVPRVAAPSRKVTVPTGLSTVDVTVAVKLTLLPYVVIGADEITVVAVDNNSRDSSSSTKSLPFLKPCLFAHFLFDDFFLRNADQTKFGQIMEPLPGEIDKRRHLMGMSAYQVKRKTAGWVGEVCCPRTGTCWARIQITSPK